MSNTTAQYSRLTVWNAGDVLTASALNGEFNNVLNNHDPSGMGSGLTAESGLQATSDPGESGSATVPTTLEQRLQQIYYAIAEIKGQSYFYPTASTNLNLLSQPTGNLGIALEFEGQYDGASSTTDILNRFSDIGGITNAASLSSEDVVAGDFDTSNYKFGSAAYTLGSGNILAFPGSHCNPVKGSIVSWYRNLASGDYIAYNPLTGVDLYLDSVNGYLTADITEKIAADPPDDETSKNTVQVQGSDGRSGNASFTHAAMKFRCNDENGAGTDLLELEQDGADEGSQLSSQDIDINPGDGGIWFFGAKRNDPAWDSFVSFSQLPTLDTDAWTLAGTAGTVSNGVLTLSATSTNQSNYTIDSPLVELGTGSTFVFKARHISGTDSDGAGAEDHCKFIVRDDSVDQSFGVIIADNNTVYLLDDLSANTLLYTLKIDTSQWHQYWVTVDSNTINFYVDGLLRYTGTLDTSDTTAGDLIAFGDFDASTDETQSSAWEYIGIYDGGAQAPVAASTQGNLDSIGVVNSVISDQVLSALQSAKVSQVFGSEPSHGRTFEGPLNATGDSKIGDDTSDTLSIFSKIAHYNWDIYADVDNSGRINLDYDDSNVINFTSAGTVQCNAVNPTGDDASAPTANYLYKANILKAWGKITCSGGGSATVTDDHNISSASYSSDELTINIDRDMANDTYAISALMGLSSLDVGSMLSVNDDNQNTGNFIVHQADATGANEDWTSGDTCRVIVAGDQ